jgi:hypothetical protein
MRFRGSTLTVIVEAGTPELAEAAADKLAKDYTLKEKA